MADYDSFTATPGVFALETPFRGETFAGDVVTGPVVVGAGPDGGFPIASTLTYLMRAFNTDLALYVYWGSPTDPDPTGALSGYDPGDLIAIVAHGTYSS